jgi:uncharacterized repeat protein (TIGR03803 family)
MQYLSTQYLLALTARVVENKIAGLDSTWPLAPGGLAREVVGLGILPATVDQQEDAVQTIGLVRCVPGRAVIHRSTLRERNENGAGKVSGWDRAFAVLLFCVATANASSGQTFTSLVSFDGTDGNRPIGVLVQATDGNFYGTTEGDGTSTDQFCAEINGCGTVFKITPTGTLTTLYNFCFLPGCIDGAAPDGGLVQGTDGNFYGTTRVGGPYQCIFAESLTCGTVFKITARGSLTTLHSFNGTDGGWPVAGLVEGTDGSFYGTTAGGGCQPPYGCGTVFKITPTGTFTMLHNFCARLNHERNCAEADGYYPQASLVQASDGYFYGVTYAGGAANNGGGTVFRMTGGGQLTTLHTFSGTDGSQPASALVQGSEGTFYGTTLTGGTGGIAGDPPCSEADVGCGTVFKMTPAGRVTTLYDFCSLPDCADGLNPGGLVQATDGNFYGATEPGNGTLYQITAGGTLTTLHSFDGTDGDYPLAALFQATDGNLYGTTVDGGADLDGTVYELSMGLRPFVETQRGSGAVGVEVKILGTNLTGTTGVTFNGTAAVFKAVSSSLITTNVPTGATTGFVTVTKPDGTLRSNKKFSVTP